MTSVPHVVGAAVIALAMSIAFSPVVASQGRAVPLPRKPVKTAPPKEWADAETVAKQKKDAQNRALFLEKAPLEFTLTADFKAVQRERSPDSTKTFPATLAFAGRDGTPTTLNILIRTRGNLRRSKDMCYDFAPIRLEFPKGQRQTKGTVFEGQNELKVLVHCNSTNQFEQIVLGEYAAYRIFNLVTPRSFRVRLAKATYIDTGTTKSLGTRYAVLIEDDDDLAKRMEGRVVTDTALLKRIDLRSFALMSLFQYMIGNLDASIIGQHNVRLIQIPTLTVYPVPYDFDYSGLVDAPYAVPPPGPEYQKLGTVRDRMYRGPCRPEPEVQAFLGVFRSIRPDVSAIFDELPGLDPGKKRRALSFLDDFYRRIDRPQDVKAAFFDTCISSGLM